MDSSRTNGSRAASSSWRVVTRNRTAGAPATSRSSATTVAGDTLSYTHEVDDKGVTSWFGEKGSLTVFRARWIDDDTLSGAWEWPGGGYKLTLTRIN